MEGNQPFVYHHVCFSSCYRRGMVIPVQFGAECRGGYVQPVPRLLNLTPEKDICIEHREDAVRCFADVATEKVQQVYESVDHYQVGNVPDEIILSVRSYTARFCSYYSKYLYVVFK
jgi:hypothetical protein